MPVLCFVCCFLFFSSPSSERCREERKELSIEIDRGVKDGEQVVFRLMAEQVVLVDEIRDRAMDVETATQISRSIDVEIAIQISRSIGLLLVLPAIYHLAIVVGVSSFLRAQARFLATSYSTSNRHRTVGSSDAGMTCTPRWRFS